MSESDKLTIVEIDDPLEELLVGIVYLKARKASSFRAGMDSARGEASFSSSSCPSENSVKAIQAANPKHAQPQFFATNDRMVSDFLVFG